VEQGLEIFSLAIPNFTANELLRMRDYISHTYDLEMISAIATDKFFRQV
jgi:hypothetical protein